MLSILSFFANLGIGTIVTKLADAYTAKQNASTDQEKIAADERIKALEAKRDLQIAEGHSPWNAMIRALIAIGPTIYLFKIFVIDKVLCPVSWQCSTDPLSPELQQVVIYVLGFYFLAETSTTVTRILKK